MCECFSFEGDTHAGPAVTIEFVPDLYLYVGVSYVVFAAVPRRALNLTGILGPVSDLNHRSP